MLLKCFSINVKYFKIKYLFYLLLLIFYLSQQKNKKHKIRNFTKKNHKKTKVFFFMLYQASSTIDVRLREAFTLKCNTHMPKEVHIRDCGLKCSGYKTILNIFK